jgi:hypothetical protein
MADHAGWSKVYAAARKGAPDALKAVGDEGEPAKNSVCKAVLAFIAGGKKGGDIRNQFEEPQYGWSRDAVDGALQVLLVAGLLRVQDDRGKIIDAKALERKAIGKSIFKVESATVSVVQRIQIRKLFQKLGLKAKQGEELSHVPEFLLKMNDLVDNASGDAPKPARPDTQALADIRLSAGNEQLLALYNRKDEFTQLIDAWSEQGKHISERWPQWLTLKTLSEHADDLPDADVIIAQVNQIEKQRLLLEEPDQVQPLVSNLTQLLRDQLNTLKSEYDASHQQGMQRLADDSNWQQLDPEQRNNLLSAQLLTAASTPDINVADTREIVSTLEKVTLSALSDRVAAMPTRFDAVLVKAAELMEPDVQFVKVPRRTIKTEQEIDAWLEDARHQIETALENGPVIIQ